MRLGLEVEVENLHNRYDFSQNRSFTIESDGSLRNYGAEFVSKVFDSVEQASSAYSRLYEKLDEENFTDRCGIHFHMDFTTTRTEDFVLFIKNYLVHERALAKEFNEIRTSNTYCNPLMDSQPELSIIKDIITRNQSPRIGRYDGVYSKYTALNIAPLSTIGTIEYRSLETGVKPNRLKKILKLFEKMREVEFGAELIPISEEDKLEAMSIIEWLEDGEPTYTSSNDSFFEQHFYTTPV